MFLIRIEAMLEDYLKPFFSFDLLKIIVTTALALMGILIGFHS